MNGPVRTIEERYRDADLLMPDRTAELANDPCAYIRGDRFRTETDTHTPKHWPDDQPAEPGPCCRGRYAERVLPALHRRSARPQRRADLRRGDGPQRKDGRHVEHGVRQRRRADAVAEGEPQQDPGRATTDRGGRGHAAGPLDYAGRRRPKPHEVLSGGRVAGERRPRARKRFARRQPTTSMRSGAAISRGSERSWRRHSTTGKTWTSSPGRYATDMA